MSTTEATTQTAPQAKTRPREATYGVRLVKHVRIPMRDGVHLSADLFMPEAEGVFPAVLEYLPYRKDDLTVRAHGPHYYFAARGYVGVRLDARGTGASPGASFDEYTAQEQQDGYDACEWLAAQPWCNGAVGAFGISYGGYTSCQLAANHPPHLKAVAPMYGFDDHYTDDCHYQGGQLRMYDMGRYGNRMLAMNALPPQPAVVGSEWAELWRERLEKSDSWLLQWLRHQTDGPYWWTGSIRNRVEAIECAVLLWGGWRDGYINPVFRMFPRLRGPKRAIIGPWMHTRPDSAIPGPQIHWLHETTRWWDQWLKGIDTGVMDEPPVAVYMQQYDPPASNRAFTTGYWRAEPALPSPQVRDFTLHLASDRTLATERLSSTETAAIDPRVTVGFTSGEFSAGGLPTFGLPTDQRPDEVYSLVFTTEPLAERLEILGNPRLVLHASAAQPVAVFSAKLSDVAPDGVSAMVCKGALNATRRESLVAPTPLEPGERYELSIQLDATGWVFGPGHRIRIAISNADFPSLWPAPALANGVVHFGGDCDSRLILPQIGEPDAQLPAPEFLPPPPKASDAPRADIVEPYQDVIHHLLDDSVEVRYGFKRVMDLPGGLAVVDDRQLSTKGSSANPANARAGGLTRIEMTWPEWKAEVEAHTLVTSTDTALNVTQSLKVMLDGQLFFHRRWLETIPRYLI